MFHELATKQKARETDIILIPEVQDNHEAVSIQNPTTPKTSQCSDASTNSLYYSMSKAIKEM